LFDVPKAEDKEWKRNLCGVSIFDVGFMIAQASKAGCAGKH